MKVVKRKRSKCMVAWYCPRCNLGEVAESTPAAFEDHKKRTGGNCGDEIYMTPVEVKP